MLRSLLKMIVVVLLICCCSSSGSSNHSSMFIVYNLHGASTLVSWGALGRSWDDPGTLEDTRKMRSGVRKRRKRRSGVRKRRRRRNAFVQTHLNVHHRHHQWRSQQPSGLAVAKLPRHHGLQTAAHSHTTAGYMVCSH